MCMRWLYVGDKYEMKSFNEKIRSNFSLLGNKKLNESDVFLVIFGLKTIAVWCFFLFLLRCVSFRVEKIKQSEIEGWCKDLLFKIFGAAGWIIMFCFGISFEWFIYDWISDIKRLI